MSRRDVSYSERGCRAAVVGGKAKQMSLVDLQEVVTFFVILASVHAHPAPLSIFLTFFSFFFLLHCSSKAVLPRSSANNNSLTKSSQSIEVRSIVFSAIFLFADWFSPFLFCETVKIVKREEVGRAEVEDENEVGFWWGSMTGQGGICSFFCMSVARWENYAEKKILREMMKKKKKNKWRENVIGNKRCRLVDQRTMLTRISLIYPFWTSIELFLYSDWDQSVF